MSALPALVEYTDPAEADPLWKWTQNRERVSVRWTRRTRTTTAFIETAHQLCSLVFTNQNTGQVVRCSASYQKDGSCLVVYPVPVAGEMHKALAQMWLETAYPSAAADGPCPRPAGGEVWPTANQPVLGIGDRVPKNRRAKPVKKKPGAPAAATLV